jgi:hypothetical protein
MPRRNRACYRCGMVRRRWPDMIIVLAILGLAAAGVWAIWGDEIRGSRPAPTVEHVSGPGL